jgi:hypothetical protein
MIEAKDLRADGAIIWRCGEDVQRTGIRSERLRPVRPVAYAVSILRVFARDGEPKRCVTLARALGLPATTCFNLLRTLVREKVLTFDRVAKTYAIGSELEKLWPETGRSCGSTHAGPTEPPKTRQH